MQNPAGRKSRGTAAAGLLAASILLAVPLVWLATYGWFAAPEQHYTTSPVIRGKLPLAITSSGRLECQVRTEITNRVFNLGNDDGTAILYLIPDGTVVRKGDLLVQLDHTAVKDRLDRYMLYHVRYRARQIEAAARLENQKLRNETNLADAIQDVKLAELALHAYEQGTYEIMRDQLARKVEAARNQVKLAKASVDLEADRLHGIRMLADAGYRGKQHVRTAELQYLRAVHSLESAENELDSVLAELRKFDRFEDPISRKKLEANLKNARRRLQQVRFQNKWLLSEREADKRERDESVARYKERIEMYTNQVKYCSIYAPHDGIVIYANDRYGRKPSEGGYAYFRQTLLYLPDITRMQVKTRVNEAEFRHLRPGLPATVHVMAFPDRSYPGTVRSVAAVPAPLSRYVQDVQVFEVIVTIDQVVHDLRPGMTGVVDIHIDRDEEVLQVPVEAVHQEAGGQLVVYVEGPHGPERRLVQIGDSNAQMVEIRSGLEEGQQVVLFSPQG